MAKKNIFKSFVCMLLQFFLYGRRKKSLNENSKIFFGEVIAKNGYYFFTPTLPNANPDTNPLFFPILHSVEISWFYCLSDFTWNQIWRIWKCLLLPFLGLCWSAKIKIQRLQMCQNWQILKLWIHQHWFHVKFEWQKNSVISSLCCINNSIFSILCAAQTQTNKAH